MWGKGNQEYKATLGCILSSRKTWVVGDLRGGGEKGVGGTVQMSWLPIRSYISKKIFIRKEVNKSENDTFTYEHKSLNFKIRIIY